MTKSELRTGHLVTFRNGDEYMVFRNCDPYNDTLVRVDNDMEWMRLESYNDDLTFDTSEMIFTTENECKKWDIMKVRRVSHPYAFVNHDYNKNHIKTIWERHEKKKYTYAQLKEILGEEFEIVKE